jgi:hypothetical protein
MVATQAKTMSLVTASAADSRRAALPIPLSISGTLRKKRPTQIAALLLRVYHTDGMFLDLAPGADAGGVRKRGPDA